MTDREFTIGEALDLAVQFAMEGNHANAVTMCKGVLIHEPENFEAIQRLGTSLFAMGKYYEALYWFWRGLKLERKHPLALTNYGLCVSQLGHWEEGLPDLKRAVYAAEKAGDKLSAGAKSLIYNNLGNCLERLKRHAEALVALDKGIACDPSDPFPWYNRGIALLRLNRHHEAIDSLNKSLTLQPPIKDSASRLNEADARYNLGMAHLLLGDIKNGFEGYEHRLLTSENTVPNLGLPPEKKWTGQPIVGERILVHAEQGYGDTIQFMRFVPELVARGASVQVVVHNGLKPIAAALTGTTVRDREIPGIDTEINVRSASAPVTVLDQGEISNDSYDYWVAMMSLPLRLGIDSEDKIPPPWWPEQNPNRVAMWANKTPLASTMPNVGICWAGNFQHKNDGHRSIDLKLFAKLFDAPCNFISLQQMHAADTQTFADLKEKHGNLFALHLEEWWDTAAVMANLDLVISVDTAVVHLAGSVGVPTWALIPAYSTDWRWQLHRSDSPWYPSMRLIRQHRIGDWGNIISYLKEELVQAAARHSGRAAA